MTDHSNDHSARQPSDESIVSLSELIGLDPAVHRHILSAALRQHMKDSVTQGADHIITLALDEYFADADQVRLESERERERARARAKEEGSGRIWGLISTLQHQQPRSLTTLQSSSCQSTIGAQTRGSISQHPPVSKSTIMTTTNTTTMTQPWPARHLLGRQVGH